MKLSKHFEQKEFTCKCCGKFIFNKELIDKLEKARGIAGVPFLIKSGTRCQSHNREVGGVMTSGHIYGLAVDIQAQNSQDRFNIVFGLIKAGFKRIGLSEKFIHADIDTTKPQEVFWMYN